MDITGLFHYGSYNYISRYDFAIDIATFFNLDINLIRPIKTEQLKQVANRPLNTSLDCEKIKENFDISLQTTTYYLDLIKNII